MHPLLGGGEGSVPAPPRLPVLQAHQPQRDDMGHVQLGGPQAGGDAAEDAALLADAQLLQLHGDACGVQRRAPATQTSRQAGRQADTCGRSSEAEAGPLGLQALGGAGAGGGTSRALRPPAALSCPLRGGGRRFLGPADKQTPSGLAWAGVLPARSRERCLPVVGGKGGGG